MFQHFHFSSCPFHRMLFPPFLFFPFQCSDFFQRRQNWFSWGKGTFWVSETTRLQDVSTHLTVLKDRDAWKDHPTLLQTLGQRTPSGINIFFWNFCFLNQILPFFASESPTITTKERRWVCTSSRSHDSFSPAERPTLFPQSKTGSVREVWSCLPGHQEP